MLGSEVGEQFIRARSASWSASDGEGALKEKSRKRAAMAAAVVRVVYLRGSSACKMVASPGHSGGISNKQSAVSSPAWVSVRAGML